jgi:inhibitor of KinA sporulation pathway (predicted exonuclease)
MSTAKNILVIDVEATCWDNLPPNKFPDTQNEIIEIGLAVIDIKAQKIVESRSIIVLPFQTSISPFCTQLTTLTPEFVQANGIPFVDAMNILDKEYRAERQIFASWGDYDRRSFEKNCKWNKVRNPMSNMHLNVKALYGALNGEAGGMAKCAKELGISFEGTHHRGVDDAKMIAKIYLDQTFNSYRESV